MQIRSLLLSTVVVFSAAGVSHALAGPMLQPQGNWAVTKVDVKQPDGVPYCAMARRYGNGSIVTFARNAKGETSLAIDLPPASLKQGQSYTVMLDPGANESRTYKTQAVSERGLVIRMGQDEAFYNTLIRNGRLGITVGEQSYNYSMPDMGSGAQNMASCLGVAAPENKPAPQTASAPGGGDSLAATKAKIEKAADNIPSMSTSAIPAEAGELQSLKDENIRLRNALESERRTYEDKMQQEDGNSSSVSELNEKLQLLQSENAQLKDKLTAAAKPPVAAAVPVPAVCPAGKVDDARFEALKQQNTDLKAALDQQTRQAKEQAAMKPVGTAGADLMAENSRLHNELEAQKQKIADLEVAQKTAALRTDKTAASQSAMDKAALSKANGDAAAAIAQVSALKDQIAKLQAENTTLQASLKAKQDAATASADTSVGTIARMHALEDQLAQAKQDRDNLTAQLTALKTANAATGPASGVNIASNNWDLEKATERYNEAEHEVTRLGSMIESERAKCTVEKQNIEYKLFDPKIASKEQVAKLTDLENQLAIAKQQLGAAGVDKQKTAADQKAIDDLKQQLASANTQIEQLKQDQAATSRKVAANDQSALVESLKQEVASLNNQVANVESEKSSLAEKLARISTASGPATGSIPRRPAPDAIIPPTVEVDSDALNAVDAGSKAPLSIIGNAGSVSAAPAAVTATPLPASPAVPAMNPETKPLSAAPSLSPSSGGVMSADGVGALLKQAKVQLNGSIEKTSPGGGAEKTGYHWKTQNLFGSIEQRPMTSPAQYNQFVQDYLDRTKARCKQQYGAVPGVSDMNGPMRMSAYEIACIGDKSGSGNSASLLFYANNGVFMAIAHEGSSDAMDTAMDIRDRLAGVLDQSKTASR